MVRLKTVLFEDDEDGGERVNEQKGNELRRIFSTAQTFIRYIYLVPVIAGTPPPPSRLSAAHPHEREH